MSDLSVTKVQQALRELAEGGHDIISRPGGVRLQDKDYPMAYAHGLEFPKDNDRLIRGYTILPVSESGNVALIYSSNEIGGWNSAAHKNTVGISSASIMHPTSQYRHDDSPKHFYESMFSVEDDVDWYNPTNLWLSPESDHTLHESLSKMSKVPSYYEILPQGNSTTKYNAPTKYDANAGRLKEHNPAEAAWTTIHNNMRFGNKVRVPHPPELELRNLGKFVHVYDEASDSSHLYHPESEKMIRL